MSSVCLKLIKISFLLATLMLAFTGCGSSSSTANNGTGSIAAKLVWSAPGVKTTGKTLYLTPEGVTNVKITVSGAGISPNIIANFPATAGVAGGGTINGIPAGTDRTVKAEGTDKDGFIRYQGAISGISVVAGQVTNAGFVNMTAPVTTASPAGGTYASAQSVTLTSNTPATIYYTTSGLEPTISSTKGFSPVSIDITETTTLKFFAIDAGFAQEFTKTETYTINLIP